MSSSFEIICPLISSYIKELLPAPISLPSSLTDFQFVSSSRELIGTTRTGHCIHFNVYSRIFKKTRISNRSLYRAILYQNDSMVILQESRAVHLVEVSTLYIKKSGFLDSRKQKIVHIWLSPDEKFILCTLNRGNVIRWNIDDMKDYKVIISDKEVLCVGITSDFLLVVGYENRIGLYGLGMEKLAERKIDIDSIFKLKFSNTGKFIIAFSVAQAVGMYKNKLEICFKYQGEGEIFDCEFSKDEKYLIVLDSQRSLVFVDVPFGEKLLKIPMFTDIKKLWITRDNAKIFAMSTDHLLTLKFPKSSHILSYENLPFLDDVPNENTNFIKVQSPSKDVSIQAGYSPVIYVWSSLTKRTLKLIGHEDVVLCIFVIDDAICASGSNDYNIRLWNYREGSLIGLLRGHIAGVTSLTTVEKYMISASLDHTVKIWLWEQMSLFHTITFDNIVVGVTCWNNTIITATPDVVYLWDLQGFGMIASKTLGCEIDCAKLAYDGKKILVNKVKGFFIDNPLWSNDINVWGDAGVYEYAHYVQEIFSNQEPEYFSLANKSVIMPFKINVLHLYAFKDMSMHIEKAISEGCALFNSSIQSNPLTLALCYKFHNSCISIISTAYKYQHYPSQFSILDFQDLQNINLLHTSEINKLYDMIWHPSLTALCIYTDNKAKLPKFVLSESPLIDFESLQKDFTETYSGIEIGFYTCKILLPLKAGTYESIQFLESILKSHHSIYSSELIKNIILYKWDQVNGLFSIQSAIYLCYYILLVISALYMSSQEILVIVNILSTLVSFWMIYKIFVTMNLTGWHILDIFRLLILTVYTIETFSDTKTEIEVVITFVVLLSTIQGLYYFYLFTSTRLIVKNVVKVMMRFTTFVSIIIYLLGTLGLILLASGYELQIQNFKWHFLNNYFVTLISVIMFCLLLGLSSYKYNLHKDLFERLKIIVDKEKMHVWKRNKISMKYFQACCRVEIVSESKIKKSLKYGENINVTNKSYLESLDTYGKSLKRVEKFAKKIYYL